MKRRRQLIFLIVLIIALVIIGYAIFNSRLLIIGPSITIESPENGSSFTNPFIELRGVANNTSFITLDGKQIYVDEQNRFVEQLLLPPGTSIMRLNARDRFDRETEVTLWYTYTGTSSIPETFTVPTTSSSSIEQIDDETATTASSSVAE